MFVSREFIVNAYPKDKGYRRRDNVIPICLWDIEASKNALPASMLEPLVSWPPNEFIINFRIREEHFIDSISQQRGNVIKTISKVLNRIRKEVVHALGDLKGI